MSDIWSCFPVATPFLGPYRKCVKSNALNSCHRHNIFLINNSLKPMWLWWASFDQRSIACFFFLMIKAELDPSFFCRKIYIFFLLFRKLVLNLFLLQTLNRFKVYILIYLFLSFFNFYFLKFLIDYFLCFRWSVKEPLSYWPNPGFLLELKCLQR